MLQSIHLISASLVRDAALGDEVEDVGAQFCTVMY